MKKFISIMTLGLLLVTFIGCEPQRVSISARYNSGYYSRPPRPYPNYVWIEGNWYYDNGIRVYHQGYWAPPGRHHGHRYSRYKRRHY